MARTNRIIAGIHDMPRQHDCGSDLFIRIEQGQPMIEEGWVYEAKTAVLGRMALWDVQRIVEVVKHPTDDGVLLVTFHGTKTYKEDGK